MKSLAIVLVFAFVVTALEGAKIQKVRDVTADVPDEGSGALDGIPAQRLNCNPKGEECPGAIKCCGRCVYKGLKHGKLYFQCAD